MVFRQCFNTKNAHFCLCLQLIYECENHDFDPLKGSLLPIFGKKVVFMDIQIRFVLVYEEFWHFFGFKMAAFSFIFSPKD